MTALPCLFLSHGSPMLVLQRTRAHEFLSGLGASLPRPQAILCVSAHWESAAPAVSAAAAPETIHDFYGFPEALYHLRYPAPGAPALAERVADLLAQAGLSCTIDPDRGLDHGAWVPLLLAYPEADLPVTQLSIQHHLGPTHHLDLGRALAPLRGEGVLIVGSGAVTHNLADVGARRQAGGRVDASPPNWAVEFETWVAERVAAGEIDRLAAYRGQAPHAATAHPRDEHFLPILVAAGAGGPKGRSLHRSFEWASLSMAAFAFEGAGAN